MGENNDIEAIFSEEKAGDRNRVERDKIKEQRRSLRDKIQHERFFRVVYRLSWIILFYIAIFPIWLHYTDQILSSLLKTISLVILLITLLFPSCLVLIKHFFEKKCGSLSSMEEDESDRTVVLEEKYVDIRKRRLAERFLWIFSLLIIINFYTLPNSQTWSAPLIAGLFELFFIMVCGTYLGVDHIYTVVTSIIEKWKGGS